MTWTAADIPDQSGRTVVVTGANSGIGLVAARGLAAAGARVVIACRDVGKGEAAAQVIRAAAPGADLEILRLDLADLSAVEAFAGALHERVDHLDVLVNNAGVMATPLRRTADGFELQFGTNHLGHFALTGRVLDLLLAAPAPRVVSVASNAHKLGRMNWDDLGAERGYRKWPVYAQSKLANLLFTYELQDRAAAAETRLLAVAAHPGWAETHLQTAGPQMAGNGLEERLNVLGNRLFAQPADMGGLPTLYAATMDVPPGAYVGPDGPLEMRGHPQLTAPVKAARDVASRRRLWAVSEELTGVRYAFPAAAAAAA